MALAPYLIRTTLILCLLGLAHGRAMRTDTSDAVHGERGCEATFAEGQTAVLTFFIGHDELARADFFARLRRSNDSTGVIVICDRKSPVKCNVFDPNYKSEDIANDSFTVLIPNITREFEDTYVFQTYAKDELQSTFECILTVTDRVEKSKICSAPSVTEGNTGTITFFIGVHMLSRQDFYARVRRANKPASDIIVCDRNASTQCKTINPRYMSNGIVNETLTLWIPNISQDLEDTYMLLTPPAFTDACHLTVEKRGSENNDGDTRRALIGGMVCVIIVAIAAVVTSVCLVLKMKRKYRDTSLHSTGKTDGTGTDEPHLRKRKYNDTSLHSTGKTNGTGTDEPLLSIQPDKEPNHQPDNQSVHDTEESSPKEEKWYYGMIQREEEKSLFEYRRNGEGSFLIRQRITNPAHFTLAVNFKGDIQRFVIVPEENGFKCIETGRHFKTLPQLVTFYCENDIQVGRKVWGKLSNPVERELKAEWYFGDVSDSDETKLLESGKEQETGTFLVKDGSGVHDYILSVNVGGIVKHFPIIQENTTFRLLDTGDSFPNVSELVDYYKELDTETEERPIKLKQPAKKEQQEEDNTDMKDEGSLCGKKWYYGNISREEEHILLKYRRNGPGSFLIRKRITNLAHFTLSVLFEGEIQRFTIVPETNCFRCIETNGCFPTLPHLVDFYKKHNIEVDDKVWGKLSKPFQKELEAEWYFGHIRDKDEAKLLKSGEKDKTGTFLVKDGTRGLHDYILSVNENGIVRRFPVVERNNVFNLPDTGGSFQTVLELVNHYKQQHLGTGEEVFKLSKPAEKEPEEEWYHASITADEDEGLAKSKRKQQGYFRIAPGNTNPNYYILKVFFQEKWRRYPIRAERCGFLFLDTDMFFHSWHELVDYYSTNHIRDGSTVSGTLTRPFRKEPCEEWYYGKFDREEEKELLSVEENEAGAFLIREGISDPDVDVLTVNVEGKLNHFTIQPEETGYKVRDTDDFFPTLAQLVDHYSKNEIKVGEKSYGKLTTPFKRKKKTSIIQKNAKAILTSKSGHGSRQEYHLHICTPTTTI